MSRVLVTGCNGTIGRYVTQALLDSGRSVVGVSLEPRCRLSHSKLQYYALDVCDAEAVKQVLAEQQPDVLVHLAALVHVRSQKLGFLDYSRMNYRASESLFRLSMNSGIRRIIFASTIEVYGRTPANQSINESEPARPESDYARSKALAEQALGEIAREFSCDYAIMRLAPVYAPDFTLNLDKRLYLRPPIGYYLSKGNYSLGLCSVGNICHFVTRWLEADRPQSGIFNVADARSYTIAELLERERRRGRCKITVRLPWSLCLIGSAFVETGGAVLGRQPGMLSVENVRKLMRSAAWDTSRAQSVVGSWPWGMDNTQELDDGRKN